jgi:hypothetical protein
MKFENRMEYTIIPEIKTRFEEMYSYIQNIIELVLQRLKRKFICKFPGYFPSFDKLADLTEEYSGGTMLLMTQLSRDPSFFLESCS